MPRIRNQRRRQHSSSCGRGSPLRFESVRRLFGAALLGRQLQHELLGAQTKRKRMRADDRRTSHFSNGFSSARSTTSAE